MSGMYEILVESEINNAYEIANLISSLGLNVIEVKKVQNND